VRRFNFLHYTARDRNSPETLQKNPNVTVRSRGVMEKCTYCIQRINRARIEAKRNWVPGHATPDMRTVESGHGEAEPMPRLTIQTACQQSCPTEAIVFGDLNDADALVTKAKYASPWRGLNYGVLTELNTQPRTSYLERIGNPNPALAGPPAAPGGAA
jgi:molybdopterin-containing oxidoreductase family iron-sulfur binding subunit